MVLRVALLTMFVMAAPFAVSAQESIWWTAPGDEQLRESGKLEEIKDKRRVFVSVNYRSEDTLANSQPDRDRLRNAVTRVLAEYKGLEVVLSPDRADLAITVTATEGTGNAQLGAGNFNANLDPADEMSLEILVLVRGANQRNGGQRPRVVWELSSPNVQGEAAPAAAFALDGFIAQLRRVRGETTRK
jgi:hypothetical protein